MKFKELRNMLKPSRFKIALFIILFLVFVPFAEFDNGIRCIRAPCPSSSIGSIAMYLLYHSPIYQIYIISIIVGAVAAYLISCLLVSLAANVLISRRRK